MLARSLGLLRPERREQATAWGSWPGDSLTGSGHLVSPQTSLQLLAVYGCVRIIADGISTLPIECFRELPDGSRVEIAPPDWVSQPTVDLSWTDWCAQVLTSLLLAGNAFAYVTRLGGRIVELIPIDPGRVMVRRTNGMLAYHVDGFRTDREILHIKGIMWPGSDVGLSPIESARQVYGIATSAAEHGQRYFDTDGAMPGVIEIPGKAQPEQMSTMAQAWRRLRTKSGQGLPGVLESGATWKPTGVNHEQMEFLATRQYSDSQIAGELFLLDPQDIGIGVTGTSLTYANLADRNTRRVQVAFMPWIVRVEKAISTLMANPRFMKIEVDGLLRGSASDRYAVYKTASDINAAAFTYGQPPIMLTSEMRELEDMVPIPNSAPPPGEETTPDPTEGAD